MTTYYGFNASNSSDEPAWFHTPEAALRFAKDCGWTTADENEEGAHRSLTLADVEESTSVEPDSVMDAPDSPWMPSPHPVSLTEAEFFVAEKKGK